MVYQVSGSQELSQKNVQTITARCLNLVTRAAVFEPLYGEYILPVLKYYAEQTPKITLETDPVKICWNLLRQGGMPCSLMNKFRGGTIAKINPLATPVEPNQFNNQSAQDNIKAFITACRFDLFMKEDEIFDEKALYTEDTNTLAKIISITDVFFDKITKVQRINFEKRVEELREKEPLLCIGSQKNDQSKDENHPSTTAQSDMRLKVLNELIETEHQYVGDLEKLQSFSEEIRIDKVISPKSQARIFSNLNALVDFQRRFALQMQSVLTSSVLKDVAASYSCHIGKLFIDNEKFFSVYEEFCANQKQAQIAIDEEKNALMTKQEVMDPNVIFSYLIKPIQRICKYPLLLRELLKNSQADAPDREELQEAYTSITRAAKRVNELERKKENELHAAELKNNVTDWKQIGRDKDQIGELLLHEKTNVMVSDSTKEMGVYLFSVVLLMVRESRSLIRTTKAPLAIRGAIWPEQLTKLEITLTGSTYGVKLTVGQQQLTVFLRNEELCKLWAESLKNWSPSVKLDAKLESMLSTGPAPAIAATVATNNAKPRTLEDMRRRRRLRGERPNVAGAAGQGEDFEEAPTRVKMVVDGEMYIRITSEISSISQLKEMIIEAVKPDFEHLHRPWKYTKETMRLKYVDEFKDLINLLTEDDLLTAFDYCPNYIAVHVMAIDNGSVSSTDGSSSVSIKSAEAKIGMFSDPPTIMGNSAIAEQKQTSNI